MNAVWKLGIAAAFVAALGCVGCDGSSERPRPPETLPETIAVPEAQVEVGTANGTLRKLVNVQRFSISRFPIIVRRYRECVQARACTRPSRKGGGCAAETQGASGWTFTDEVGGRDELPVTCTDGDQAARFCRWVGGRLPTIEEWLYAARGPSVQPYPWGRSAPTCEQHPHAIALLGKEECCTEDGCTLSNLFAVGKHAAGKSPVGLEDALLAPAELVGFDERATMPGCRTSKAGCVVSTLHGASIDAVMPAPDVKNTSGATPVWSFRCAWDE